jgi:glycosyltransferase involved in cell wall biosynthesis
MKPIAFVIPWFSISIKGGAETLTKETVLQLIKRGIHVEIITTCVKEFTSDWNINYYKEGLSIENDIPIRRFKVRKRNTQEFDAVNQKLMSNMNVDEQDEETFFKEMINSPELYRYIHAKKDQYHCFVFIPYMFGTSYFGVQACPEKSVLIPCFHDEPYAYMKSIKVMSELAIGHIFNALPEKNFAEKIYNISGKKLCVIGMGLDVSVANGETEEIRKKCSVDSEYILYAGRKDKGKNIDELIQYFTKYRAEKKSNVKLVLIGGGKVEIPEEFSHEIIDFGFLSKEEKEYVFKNAMVFCNPSKNESFSIVIMESWLAGTPVIVNGECEVTKDFCIQSKAGLYYHSYLEFRECVDLIQEDRQLNNVMGENGRTFVKSHYTWDKVCDKYIDYFKNLYEGNY